MSKENPWEILKVLSNLVKTLEAYTHWEAHTVCRTKQAVSLNNKSSFFLGWELHSDIILHEPSTTALYSSPRAQPCHAQYNRNWGQMTATKQLLLISIGSDDALLCCHSTLVQQPISTQGVRQCQQRGKWPATLFAPTAYTQSCLQQSRELHFDKKKQEWWKGGVQGLAPGEPSQGETWCQNEGTEQYLRCHVKERGKNALRC